MNKQEQVPENDVNSLEGQAQKPLAPLPEMPSASDGTQMTETRSHDVAEPMPDVPAVSDRLPVDDTISSEEDEPSEESSDTDTASEKEPSTKKRKPRDVTPEEIKFREMFQSNFNYAMEHPPKGRKKSQADVVRKLNVNKSVVSGWANGTSTPSAFYLVELSQFLGRKAGWMLEDHSFSDKSPDTKPTYTDIFKNLLPMIDLEIIDRNSIKDYFLRHMVERYYEIKRLKRIPEKTKNEWLIKLYSDYGVPIQPKLEYTAMYTALEEEYGQVDKDSTVLVLLGLVREYWEGKKDEVNRIFAEWYNNADPKLKQESDVQATIQQLGIDAFFNDQQDE